MLAYDGLVVGRSLLQRDPLGLAAGMNVYAYCGCNPVNFIDPWGLARQGMTNRDALMMLWANPDLLGPGFAAAWGHPDIAGNLERAGAGFVGGVGGGALGFAAGGPVGAVIGSGLGAPAGADAYNSAATGTISVSDRSVYATSFLLSALTLGLSEVFGGGAGAGTVSAADTSAASLGDAVDLASSAGGRSGTSIDPVLLDKIRDAFASSGGVIDQSADAVAYLDLRGVQALTLNATTVLLRPDATAAEVFEEFIHVGQFRQGLVTSDMVDQLELNAAQRLVNNANTTNSWQLDPYDVQVTQTRLDALQRKLGNQ